MSDLTALKQNAPGSESPATPDFRVLFESAPGLYLVLTPDLKIVAVSDAYLRATMTQRDAILGRGIFEVFPDNPHDPHATGVGNLSASLDRVLGNKATDAMAVQKYDIRRPEAEGGGFEERYWSPVNSPVVGPGGEVAYIIHRVEDVTEFLRLRQHGVEREKQTQEALRRSEERFRLLVEGTQDYAIFLLDAQGHVASWNPGAERIKGYKAEEIIGRHFSKFYPQEAIDRGWPAHELKVAQAEGRFEDEGWRVRKDGRQFWANVVITALHDEAGKFLGYSKITRDLTERKRSEENARRLVEEAAARRVAEEDARLIQEQRERLHVTLASIGDAVISTDAEGRVDFLNPVAENLVGWKNEEAARHSLEDVFRIVNDETRQPVANPALRALKEGVIVGLANHTILIAKDGKERPIDDSAAPIRDAGGSVIGSVLVFRDISEKKQAEQRLREQQEWLRVTLASIGDAVIATDTQGRVTFLNGVAQALTGWTEADAKSQPLEAVFAIVNEQTGQPVENPVGKVLRDGAIVGLGNHTVLIAKDGTERPIDDSAAPIRDMAGKLIGVVLIFRDVTEQRRNEREVRQSEQELAEFFENATVALHWVGPDGIILRANKAELDMLGYSLGEYVGRPIADFHADEDVICDILKRLTAGEKLAEYPARLRSKDGSIKDVLIDSSVLFRDGEFVHTRCFTRDVTERKRAEDALRQSEQKAHFLANASAALASVVDYESTLQKVANLAVPHFADWSAVDVANDDGTLRRLAVAHQDPVKVQLAHELMRQYPPDPQATSGAFAVLRTGKPERVREITDNLLVQGAKDERHLHLIRSLGLKSYVCVPLVVSGKTLGVLTFATAESGRTYTDADLALAVDLANRASVAVENTQLYQALRETDRRKDEFLATLAHELRNPLAPIRNALQILKMPKVDAATVGRSRDMMERQVEYLVRLVDDLLDVSRVMRGKIELRKERAELATVIARAVETVQPLVDAQGHQLSVRLTADSLPVDADPVRLAQVVGNLLTNAAKYTEPHGRIWLTAEREGGTAVLRLRDTGIGIAPQMLPRIFELFMQVDHASTKAQGGLGIGLTLVKNLVEMHNGTVEARSEGLGRGSEFVVRLPISAQVVESDQGGEPVEQVSQRPAASGYRLLVVDDNQDAADSLAMLLKLQGHEVRVAFSGMAALEMTKTYTPDVVFLDIGMPGINGYEVARRLRQQPGMEKVVLAALTGWGQKEDRRRTAEAGFNHHLVKPPEPKALEGILAALPK